MGNQNLGAGYFFITVVDKAWGKKGLHGVPCREGALEKNRGCHDGQEGEEGGCWCSPGLLLLPLYTSGSHRVVL